ncbi:MAG TPA: type II CRISPR RNA-guided endonuclease Cas9 [Sedimentisphaerales bacterium]|nr:type II CRISPR RNA-guided endonuclease Cas9 [Sedimentisphaerales bacterium]
MSSYILGLKIGRNAVGWVLLQKSQEPSIMDIGVRAFPEGVGRDTKGAEKSKNTTRREARGTRRVHGRRNFRRDQLVKTLRSRGLLPDDDQELCELFKREPYGLRARGLDEKLSLYEFGRALFHMNQRRGFKSSRKTGTVNRSNIFAKEGGALQRRIREADCRTLGEYLANTDPEKDRIRGRCTLRSMYEREFDLLWDRQSHYYQEVLTEDLRTKIRDEIVFYQRPRKPMDEFIGQCELEPGEKRCPRGDWYARRFRLLQNVNNLKIQNADGSEAKLTTEQRRVLLGALEQEKEIEFDKVREMLGLRQAQQFNLEKDGKVKSLKGDFFAAAMRSSSVFGSERWDAMEEQKRIEISNAVLELDDEELVRKMINEYNLTDKQAKGVLKVSMRRRYMSFSRKAIQRLLPFMEQGASISGAIQQAGYQKGIGEEENTFDKLPLPDDLRNPIVNKALFEVRKVVNSIISEYGKPTGIVLEIARDMKESSQERQDSQYRMQENERRNEDARMKLIEDMNIPDPKRDDIIKYKLWKECRGRCPYTGKFISQTALFGTNPHFRIDHILPYSRSLDDSYMNKTLCCATESNAKSNKVPYEAYGHDEEEYEQIKQRIACLPWPKRRKFLQKEIHQDECINRELNDNRYINREVVKYVRQLGVPVSGTRGRTTGELRHQWGLDSILDFAGERIKNRDDHRHHAVDAAVVAVREKEHLRRLAESKYSKVDSGLPEPWPNYRNELAEKVKHINVSHRVTRRARGQLHNETSYGATGREDEKGQEIFVYRKKLEELTMAMVAKIVDPVVRNIVLKRLKEHGLEPEKDKGKQIPKNVWNEPLLMKSRENLRIPIKKVRIEAIVNNREVLRDRSGEPYRVVATQNNHHIEIFKYTDKFDKQGLPIHDSEPVSMFEAVRRKQSGQPIVNRNHGPNTKFICSLAINEMVLMKNKGGELDLYRVQAIPMSKQIFFRHHTAASLDYNSQLIRQRTHSFRGQKVTVDPLGRMHRAHD